VVFVAFRVEHTVSIGRIAYFAEPCSGSARREESSSMTEYGGFTYPSVSPYIFYEDVGAALDFLAEAFGFTVRMRNENPDGSLSHCEMAFGDSVVMLGSPPNFRGPGRLGSVTVGIHVHVDDVDAHYARAVAAGAKAEREPVDMPYGVRSYAATDPEGHQWYFAQPLS
jgi:PhnB protein